jgi:uncharacterized repeat protein (TIGR01451 family)
MEEDILAPDAGNNRLHVFSTIAPTRHPGLLESGRSVTSPQMHLLASLEAESAPLAVLPLRLSKSGLSGLVVLQDGQSKPIAMQQAIPPANIFTVTNTSDGVIAVGTEFTGPTGSLRAAIYNANNATGAAEIDFNIPTSDPGYNASTGAFLIQPLSEGAPGGFNNFALPPINQTVTIDGYTQPGASPNTSSTSDNAKILIQIDGGMATTPGGAGLVPFDDTGSTFRGMDFTGWTNPEITTGSSGATASGAEGMEANGVGDYIEGDFFGTDPTGTLATNTTSSATYGNRIGIFADNGPGFGNSSGGNIIGGTTPQARNILSNNTSGGILFLSTALEAHLEGDFIGLDASGAKSLGNVDDGAGSNGPTITIGGTLPGDGNVISGNGTDVDFNDLTNGGQASDSIAQGNLIGTDGTGTLSVSKGSGAGASILSGPSDETIGGTTPAARNVISGNAYGVYIFNNTTGNIVQGNYIGTDITGTIAIGNSLQGFYQGATDSTQVPATNTILGGSAAGAGNLISGNTLDGVSISGTAPGGPSETDQGSTILGNYIGTDVTGTKALGNGGAGISLLAAATNNIIGGNEPGDGNIISFNKASGVLIDSASSGAGTGNQTIGNVIDSNRGAGVLVESGTSELISQNSIYQNSDLGIVLGATGPPLANQACSSTATGANNLENYPTLTGGSGSLFTTATATDSNGNTSEFSNAVQESTSGSLLNLVGSFVGNQPNTNYTIEFFSSPTADPSGYGQGQTYLGSAQVTTGSDCTVAFNNPVNPNDADMSITLTNPDYELETGPDFGQQVYTSSVVNLGPATATNVVVTDVLPSSLGFSSLYCNVGPCQSSVTTSVGSCTATGQTVTCNLGTMAAGQTATVNIPVEALMPGAITDTVTVAATQTDPVLANNTSSVTLTSTYPEPFIDYPGNGTVPNFVPNSAIAGSSDLPVTIYGTGFIPSSSVSFNGTALPTVSFVDNQICGTTLQPYYCAGIEVVVPAALLTTASTPNITVTNPNPGPGNVTNVPSTGPFNIYSACTFSITPSPDFSGRLANDGTTLIAENVSVAANAPSCSWAASSSVNWVVPLESTPITGQYTSIDFAVAPNSGSASRSGSITVAGQIVDFTQAGGSSCDHTLGSTSASFTAAGGAGSVNVTPNSSSCAPYVVSFAPWITIPSNAGLLINNQPANFTVAANTGAVRTGTIMIGGYVFTVNQASPACSYALSPATALWGAAGGTGSFGVTASASSCAWTAASTDTSVASITSGASGTGNGTVNYSVAANQNGPQTPTITVADTNGGSSTFAINQASDYTCTFTIAPSPVNVPADGSSNFFLLTASNSFCQWTATSGDSSALSITLNSSGTGTSVIYYAVAQNAGGPRTLTITAGCQIFTVNQAGNSATSNPTPAITSLSPASVVAGSGAFTLTVNGSGFISTSVVNLNGSPRVTTYVSSTQLTAAILSTDVAAAGLPAITVTNPAPGGGTSNSATLNVTAVATSAATLTSALSFPNTTVNTTSPAQAATLTNTGSTTLNISNIAIGGANPSDFAIATGAHACGSTLVANASCSIYVTFTPAAAQSYAATLTVTDDATPSTQSTSLSGTGTAAPAAAASLTPASLSFTAVSGATSAAQTAALTNTGNAMLTISSIGIVGTNPTDFAETSTCGTSLAAGASCTISITFSPASAASFTATLSVADDAGGSPQTVALSGAGTAAPSFTISSSTGAQSIVPGGSASYTITVTPQNGAFSSPITFLASGLPSGATAAFQPATVTPDASAASTTLTITAAATTAAESRGPAWPLAAPVVALIGFLFVPGKRRRQWLAMLVLCAVSFGTLAALSSCGGGFAHTSTAQAQSYTVTITANGGGVTQTTNVEFTVQQ